MQAKLKVLIGSNAGREIPISGPKFLIGRDEQCQLRPRSDMISRQHCEISVHDGQLMVRDLGSRNGTLINGKRIEGPQGLKTGDQLKLGKLEFEVLIEHTLAAPKRPKSLDIKEVAARTAAPLKAENDIGDISDWLEEADQVDRDRRLQDPDTRQFRLDETDRLTLEKSAKIAEEENAASNSKTGDSKTGDSKTGDTKTGKAEKKEPGKLPKSALNTSKDSRDAAADTLKKFFNRR